MDNTQHSYFSELGIVLRKAGYTEQTEQSGFLQVGWNGRPLCRIGLDGSTRYRPEDMTDQDTESARWRATDIAGAVREYTALMEQAPDLKADGLSEGYKLLAEFNGAVLAGHLTKQGTEFITWEWSYGKTGLWQGHYYGPGSGSEGYLPAKEDFCLRAGLLERNRLFSPEQLAEVYRCVHETLDEGYAMTPERQKLLEGVAEQIREAVPDLDTLVQQSNEKEMEVMAEESVQSLTQQI